MPKILSHRVYHHFATTGDYELVVQLEYPNSDCITHRFYTGFSSKESAERYFKRLAKEYSC